MKLSLRTAACAFGALFSLGLMIMVHKLSRESSSFSDADQRLTWRRGERCQCAKHDAATSASSPLCYRHPYEPTLTGKAFPCSLEPPIRRAITTLIDTALDRSGGQAGLAAPRAGASGLVYVISMGPKNVKRVRRIVSNFQRFVLQGDLYVYDMGLPKKEANLVRNSARVYLRQLDLNDAVTRRISLSSSISVLVVLDALKYHDTVLFVSPEVEFRSSEDCFTESDRNIVLYSPNLHHSSLWTKGFTQYYPVVAEHMSTIPSMKPSAIFIRRRRESVENVLKWWLLCTLDDRCSNCKTFTGLAVACDNTLLPYLLRNYYVDGEPFVKSAAKCLQIM